jgi:2-C-methyl-D-erythritol 4-phosphate cytidylyltransferase
MLSGLPVVSHSINTFDAMECVSEIVLALPASYADYFSSAHTTVIGGQNRQQSVYNALQAVSPQTDVVLIHDGARPFVSRRLIEDIIECAGQGHAAVAGVPATDTIKQTDALGWVTHSPDRSGLWSIQTPQGFPYGVIIQAHRQAAAEGFVGTDDSMLVERYALARVKIIPGERLNLKITTPEDMIFAEAVLHT